jgi:hypothetical protein
VANQLAVSGDTVRRWEAGVAHPGRDDLLRFAEVAHLSGTEQAFLLQAFSAIEVEAPPDPAVLRKQTDRLLSEEFPSYIYDSLFFVRAWNSYMDLVHNKPFMRTGENLVARIFEERDPQFPESRTRRSRDERAEWWLRAFWFHTARLCGSPAYVQVVETLAQNPRFVERWRSLGLMRDSDSADPIGAPTFRVEEGKGSFWTSTTSVEVPPTYFLREFVPADQTGWDQLTARRELGPPVITHSDYDHWSQHVT